MSRRDGRFREALCPFSLPENAGCLTDMNRSKAVWRVLVVPAGTEIGLEVARSLSACKEVELFGAGRLECSPGPFKFARMLAAPMVDDEGFAEALCAIVRDHGITHVFAAHDDVLFKLSAARDALGAKLVTSSHHTCRIARSKRATVEALRGVVPVPALYDSVEAVTSYPVFVKPDAGQGSRGACVVKSKDQLEIALAEDPTRIIQEYLLGEEYTVDCFSDRERGLLYASGRTRARVTNGIAAHAFFVKDPMFETYARKINDVLKFHGAWFFQLKRSLDGEPRLLEVAARVAGTSGLSRVCGVNLPLLSLYEAERINVSIRPLLEGVTLDRAHTPLYRHAIKFDAVYVDLDDALLIRGRLNTLLIRVLYQCVNKSIPVVLVTRHEGNLEETLRKHRISHLFDEVVHLRDGESKRAAIRHDRAVFIDDSFRELVDTEQNEGVVAIHPSAAEVLLEDYD
jgi:carbamoyl-phosphate synthase large subunit